VKFGVTTVPRETDLNKLFEVINNRGVQLQHHEILKARMLDALPELERGPYAVLWEACADMENFIERNLSGISGLLAHEIAALHERRELANPEAVRVLLQSRMQQRSDHHVLGLEETLNSTEETETSEAESDAEEADPT